MHAHPVGTLRRFFKLTELDDARAAELSEAGLIRPSPAAAIVVDPVSRTLLSQPDNEISAHLVIGWEEGRGSVTDFLWDYLPILGHAFRDRASGEYVLHREQVGSFRPMTMAEAEQANVIDSLGMLNARES